MAAFAEALFLGRSRAFRQWSSLAAEKLRGMTSSEDAGPTSALWARWGDLTRSLISTRVAIERERSFWESLNFTNRSNLKIKAKARGGGFTIRLVDHVRALDDEGTVLAAALVLSYSLAEAAANDRLGLDSRRVAGIEDWGGRLLKSVGAAWSQVEGGLAGAVEIGVIRNLIVHGADRVDEKSHQRLATAGCAQFEPGSPVRLDYDAVGVYRARLRSLLMVGGLGWKTSGAGW